MSLDSISQGKQLSIPIHSALVWKKFAETTLDEWQHTVKIQSQFCSEDKLQSCWLFDSHLRKFLC